MGLAGLVRPGLLDKTRRMSGVAWPWRAAAGLAAREVEPETIPSLLVAPQRFFCCGHPFATSAYDRLLGSVRRGRLDRHYAETPAGHGLAVFDLEARRVHSDVRGAGWRRAGWLYGHEGQGFTRRRVAFRIPDSWRIRGTSPECTPLAEWNETGPEPFGFLLRADA